ncbi:MAG: alpha/beta fold hydrolase [Bacteroidota bacterium]
MNRILIYVFLWSFQVVFGQTIEVPVDYNNADFGTFELSFEHSSNVDPQKPTVIVVADAQQFYVRKGQMDKIKTDLFSEGFNVLGIIPRAFNKDLIKRVKSTNLSNKQELRFRAFQSFQYINDIKTVIDSVLSDVSEIYLYGQSGGAFLITEYLSMFPESKVKKVFIGASVNPVVENSLGIVHDNFNRDFLTKYPASNKKLKQILNEVYFKRKTIASLFQRQNFFVALSEIDSARVQLIDRLYEKDTTTINKMIIDYQIEAISNYLDSDSGFPIKVRIAEFFYPLKAILELPSGFYPDLENSYYIAEEILVDKSGNPRVVENSFNENGIRKFRGKVLLLSARFDHVADYRSCLYLNALLPNSELLLVNDNHTFQNLKKNKAYASIIQDFFLEDNIDLKQTYKTYIWREN